MSRAIDLLLERYPEEIEIVGSYGEPGYELGTSQPLYGEVPFIILANWNSIPDLVAEGLERRGHELEWSDEWIIDRTNDRCFRTSPTHYGWTPSYLMNDWTNGEVVGLDEIIETPNDYIEEYLLNDPRVAAFEDLPDEALEGQGFEKMDGDHLENGLHPGQTDDPKEVYLDYRSNNDVVFRLEGVGQFDVHFSAWLRKREE